MKTIYLLPIIKVALMWCLMCSASQSQPINDLPGLSTGNLSSGADALVISAGNEKKTAYLRFAMPGKTFNEGEFKWDIAIETPYDDSGDSGPSIFADFDGVTNSTNLQFNLSYWSIDKRPASSISAIKAMMQNLCREFLDDDNYNGGCGTGDITKDVYCKVNRISDCANEPDENYTLYVAQFDELRKRRRARLVHNGFLDPISANIFGLKSKIGRDNFKFKEASTFKDKDETESPWSITAYYYRKIGRAVYGGGLEYQDSYSGNNKTQICTPAVVPENATSCTNVVIGKPIQTRRKLAYAEFRWANTEMNFAIAPKITRDFENDEMGVLLPIYLMRDKKDALTGGVSLGWQSETDEVTASIFVGKAFEFW